MDTGGQLGLGYNLRGKLLSRAKEIPGLSQTLSIFSDQQSERTNDSDDVYDDRLGVLLLRGGHSHTHLSRKINVAV